MGDLPTSTISRPADERISEIRSLMVLYFTSRIRDAVAAEDLASEVILRLLKHIDEGRAIEHMTAWAFGIARHLLQERWRDSLRGQQQIGLEELRHEGFELVQPFAPDDPLEAERAQLRFCLAELTREDRRLILSFYAGGRASDVRRQLALNLGISMNALFLRASRVRRQLRNCARRGRMAVAAQQKASTAHT